MFAWHHPSDSSSHNGQIPAIYSHISSDMESLLQVNPAAVDVNFPGGSTAVQAATGAVSVNTPATTTGVQVPFDSVLTIAATSVHMTWH